MPCSEAPVSAAPATKPCSIRGRCRREAASKSSSDRKRRKRRPAARGAQRSLTSLFATLLLRPLNVETLATHLYGEAARGTYEDGTVAALLIVLVGLIPVALLLRVDAPDRREPRTG